MILGMLMPYLMILIPSTLSLKNHNRLELGELNSDKKDWIPTFNYLEEGSYMIMDKAIDIGLGDSPSDPKIVQLGKKFTKEIT